MSAVRLRHAGFSLIEMALVLAIIGFVLGGMLLTLSAQVTQRNIDETQNRLRQARDALIGFAIANGRLPCPATATSSGQESATGTVGSSACTNVSGVTGEGTYSGFLPAATLGFQPVDSSGFAVDAWGNRLRYVIAMKASCTDPASGSTVSLGPPSPSPSPFVLSPSASNSLKYFGVSCQPTDLVICKSSANNISSTRCTNPAPPGPDPNAVTNQNTVVAIVFSTGKDYATMTSGNTDEQINLKLSGYGGYATFVSHPPAPVGAAGGEFDDQFEWIPVGLLYGRMTAAGVLP